MEKIVSLNNVTKIYNGRIIINEVSHDFHKGDSIAFTGHNGCGKSTLLKILAGLVRINKGKVEHSRKIRFSYVPEKMPALDITAYSYLKSVASMEGVEESEFISLAEDFFVEEVCVFELSGAVSVFACWEEVFVEDFIFRAVQDHKVKHCVVPGKVMAGAVFFQYDPVSLRIKAQDSESAFFRQGAEEGKFLAPAHIAVSKTVLLSADMAVPDEAVVAVAVEAELLYHLFRHAIEAVHAVLDTALPAVGPGLIAV